MELQLVHAQALHASGHIHAAHRTIRDAKTQLRKWAADIANPVLRESFLERVPENRRILELAQDWGIDDITAHEVDMRSGGSGKEQ